jgi:hypothetical protein
MSDRRTQEITERPSEEHSEVVADALRSSVVVQARAQESKRELNTLNQLSAETEAESLQEALTNEMRGLLSGDVFYATIFVRDLISYFENGMRPGMTPQQIAEHLGGRAAFVFGRLFEISKGPAELKRPPTIEVCELNDSDATDASSDSAKDKNAKSEDASADANACVDTASNAAHAEPRTSRNGVTVRWFDFLLGVCSMSAAWKLPAALAAIGATEECLRAGVKTPIPPTAARYAAIVVVWTTCMQGCTEGFLDAALCASALHVFSSDAAPLARLCAMCFAGLRVRFAD